MLLIDDDDEDFLIISEMLSEISGQEFNLEWVSTYESGLEAIRRGEHDVYLLDYLLGARNGLELLQEAIAMDCRAPIIFLTAYGNYDIDLRAMQSGASDYLVKGEFTALLLERSIRYSVKSKSVEEELKQHRHHLEELVKERTLQHAEARADAERRAMEAEERKAILDALLEHIPEGIVIVDSPGMKIQALSRYALEMMGASRKEIEGRVLSEYETAAMRPGHKEIVHFSELPISRAVTQGRNISNEEWCFKGQDETKVPILISAGPILDQNGHVTGAVAAWRDISELKKIQQELQQARDELELRVYQRTLELAETMDELKMSEGRLKVLAAQLIRAQEDERKRIAREMHDSIGSSLTAVKFCLESAAEKIRAGSADPELLTQLSSVLDHCIEESRRIMTDLRPSLLDDLGLVVTIGWFCRRFQSLYSGAVIEETIKIDESEIPEQLKIVIFRIIQEAMNNSAKYSRADRIMVSLNRAGNCIILEVADNGTGFDLDAPASRSGPDGGLGLTSMKERTEISGGSFQITSVPGAGTTVSACWDIHSNAVVEPNLSPFAKNPSTN